MTPTVAPMLGLTRSRPTRTGTAVAVVAAMALVLTSACNKLAPAEPPPIINDYVSAVQVLGEGATTDVVNQQLGIRRSYVNEAKQIAAEAVSNVLLKYEFEAL